MNSYFATRFSRYDHRGAFSWNCAGSGSGVRDAALNPCCIVSREPACQNPHFPRTRINPVPHTWSVFLPASDKLHRLPDGECQLRLGSPPCAFSTSSSAQSSLHVRFCPWSLRLGLRLSSAKLEAKRKWSRLPVSSPEDLDRPPTDREFESTCCCQVVVDVTKITETRHMFDFSWRTIFDDNRIEALSRRFFF